MIFVLFINFLNSFTNKNYLNIMMFDPIAVMIFTTETALN